MNCARGKYFVNYNKECSYCSPGYYQDQSNVPNVTCKPCLVGTASVLNTDTDFTCQYSKTTCPPGTYHNGQTKCLQCECKYNC